MFSVCNVPKEFQPDYRGDNAACPLLTVFFYPRDALIWWLSWRAYLLQHAAQFSIASAKRWQGGSLFWTAALE